MSDGWCDDCGTDLNRADNGIDWVPVAEKRLDKVRQFALNLSRNDDRGWLSNVGEDLLELLEEN